MDGYIYIAEFPLGRLSGGWKDIKDHEIKFAILRDDSIETQKTITKNIYTERLWPSILVSSHLYN
jgi:hypothetical protein